MRTSDRLRDVPVDDGPRTSRIRGLVVGFALTVAAVLVGLSGAGVTTAFLSAGAQGGSATITAGTAALRINGSAAAALGAQALSPAAPAVWAFPVSNTGDVPLALVAATTASAPQPAYAAATRVLLVPVSGSGACTATTAGATAALGAQTASALGSIPAGGTQWFCLVLSVPNGTSAAGTGTALAFTLTFAGTQPAN